MKGFLKCLFICLITMLPGHIAIVITYGTPDLTLVLLLFFGGMMYASLARNIK